MSYTHTLNTHTHTHTHPRQHSHNLSGLLFKHHQKKTPTAMAKFKRQLAFSEGDNHSTLSLKKKTGSTGTIQTAADCCRRSPTRGA